MGQLAANVLIAITVSFVLVSVGVASSSAQISEELQQKLDEAERRIVRLAPSSFPGLPENLSKELEHRGCTIPQTNSTTPHNVIRGEYDKPRQMDWAVLCSIKDVSSILVFWNASEKNPAELASYEDRNFLQGVGGDEIAFSREITTVGNDFIMRHYEAYGGPKPPPIDHQGIDDAFVGKASGVHYFYNGQWMQLTGAD